jgi:hypothetical protein
MNEGTVFKTDIIVISFDILRDFRMNWENQTTD